jgi:hypothetical protein
MRSKQDRIPTHRLKGALALDGQGRVLREPHFVTREQHDTILEGVVYGWKQMLAMQEEETKAALRAAKRVAEMQIEDVVIVEPMIFARKRLHWLVRWLISVG